VILGHAVSEDWAIAADTIAAIPVNWSEVSARWRTLVATVWAQTGRKDAARALIQDVSWDQLLPEERALISAAMAG